MDQINQFIDSLSSVKIIDIVIAIAIIIVFKLLSSTISYAIIRLFKVKTKKAKDIRESAFYNPLRIFFIILGVYLAVLFLKTPLNIEQNIMDIITTAFKIISTIAFAIGLARSFTVKSTIVKKAREKYKRNIDDTTVSFFLKILRVIIYVIALMLVTAGYLSYTTNMQDLTANAGVETAEAKNIGDAQLVSSEVLANNTNDINSIENSTANDNSNSLNNFNITGNQTIDNTISGTTSEENSTENMQNSQNSQDSQIAQDNNSETNNTDNIVQTNANTTSSEYFTTSKLERDTMYSQMIETYEKVLNSSNALETQKQTATDEITKINNTKNSIMICENLIGTKGFNNNVIFVNGNSITAIIGATELKPEEVAQIQNIIAREMNASIENIHIAIK